MCERECECERMCLTRYGMGRGHIRRLRKALQAHRGAEAKGAGSDGGEGKPAPPPQHSSMA
eukprot:gene32988-13740_t